MKKHDPFIPWAADRVLFGGMSSPSTTMEYRKHWGRLMVEMKAVDFMDLKIHVEVAEITCDAIRRMMDRTPNVLSGKETED